MSKSQTLHRHTSPEMVSAHRRFRNELVRDNHRPLYHIVAPEGVCRPFDPNGAIWWKGRYHLFYIFQDEKLPNGGHSWGHVSSVDLVHWRHHPTALAPGAGDPEKGIFSGCALISKEGIPTLVYLGVDSGICIAQSNDDSLDVWTKSSANPVIPMPAEGDKDFGKYVVHDPHVWLEKGAYHAIINGWAQWDTAYLFSSTDLIHWEYKHKFYEPRIEWTDKDEDVACPDFFPIGDRHMLLCISHKRGCRYYLGSYRDELFYPEEHARMNWAGGPCFAPESLLDPRGRRIFWAWALDRRPDESSLRSGWSGCMTLPRLLSIGASGGLCITPVPELENLRGTPTEIGRFVVDKKEIIEKVTGDSFELDLEIDLRDAGEVRVAVRRSPDESELTIVGYSAVENEIFVDVTSATVDDSIKYPSLCWTPLNSWHKSDLDPGSTVQRAPLELSAGEHLVLRIFVDRSIIEVFANSRQCITQRMYPTREDATGVYVEAKGGPAEVLSLTAWPMAPSNAW